MQFYAMLCNLNDMLGDFEAMLWDLNAMQWEIEMKGLLIQYVMLRFLWYAMRIEKNAFVCRRVRNVVKQIEANVYH